MELAKEKRAIDHGVKTPRLVLVSISHLVIREVLLAQPLKLLKTKLSGLLLRQVAMHGGRNIEVLDALHKRDAGFGKLGHGGLHVAVRREGEAVLALLGRVGGEDPAVVGAGPLRAVVDESALVGGLVGRGEVLCDHGDAVAGLLEAKGGAETDDASSFCFISLC